MRWAASALLAACVLLPRETWARPVLTGSDIGASLGPGLTKDFAVAPGPDRYLIVAVAMAGNGIDVVSVAYGQAPLARLASQNTTGVQCRSELWGMVGPATGSHTVVVTTSAPTQILTSFLSYAGVDPLVPAGAWQWTTGSTAQAAVSLATSDGDRVVDALCVGGTHAASPTSATGQNPLWAMLGMFGAFSGGEREGVAPTVTVSWSVVTGPDIAWALAAVSLRSSGAVVILGDAGYPDGPARVPDGAADVSQPMLPAGDGPVVPADGSASGAPMTDGAASWLDGPTSGDAAANTVEPPAASSDAGIAGDDADLIPGRVDADLRVGCACQVSDRPRGPGAWMLVLAAALRRRRPVA
jgi:MYXO-CTERM domain-containing protein